MSHIPQLSDDAPNQYNILCDEKQSQVALVLNGRVDVSTFVAGTKPGEPGEEILSSYVCVCIYICVCTYLHNTFHSLNPFDTSNPDYTKHIKHTSNKHLTHI